MNNFLAKAFFLIRVVPVKNFPANGTSRMTDHFCSSGPWFWKPRKQNRSLVEDGDSEGDRHTCSSTAALWSLLVLCQENTWGRYYCSYLTERGKMSEVFKEPGHSHIANKGLTRQPWLLTTGPHSTILPLHRLAHSGLPRACEFIHVSIHLADPK